MVGLPSEKVITVVQLCQDKKAPLVRDALLS